MGASNPQITKALDFLRWLGVLPAAIVITYLVVWQFNSLLPSTGLDQFGPLATVAKVVLGIVCFLCVALWIVPHHKQQTLITLSLFGVVLFATTIWHVVTHL
jgi:hypothetical protein